MITIRITINFSYLEGISASLSNLFYKALRFRPKNWFHARQRRRGWDGWVCFFDADTGRFPTGLVPEIEKALHTLKQPYQIIDERIQLDLSPVRVTPDILGSDITLHDYQVDIANAAIEQKRGIIKSPTASGKTLIFTSILKALGQLPTIVLFRNKTLVNQTYKVFQQQGLEDIGRVNMDAFDPNIITCSTIQSLHKLKPLIPKCRVLIIDECHEFSSNKSVRAIKAFEGTAIRLGFCLNPDTKITLYDRVKKPLNEVKIGDQLYSWGDDLKLWCPGHVVGISESTIQQRYTITFNDGGSVQCSGNHRWCIGSHFIPTKSLQIGDVIVGEKPPNSSTTTRSLPTVMDEAADSTEIQLHIIVENQTLMTLSCLVSGSQGLPLETARGKTPRFRFLIRHLEEVAKDHLSGISLQVQKPLQLGICTLIPIYEPSTKNTIIFKIIPGNQDIPLDQRIKSLSKQAVEILMYEALMLARRMSMGGDLVTPTTTTITKPYPDISLIWSNYKHSSARETLEHICMREIVDIKEEVGSFKMIDLTVAGSNPEGGTFFANGLLSHNSATPMKKGDQVHNYKLKSWLGPIIAELPTTELQERGILANSIAYFHDINEPNDIQHLNWQDAEEMGIVHNEKFHQDVAARVAQIKEGRIMILVRRIPHGDALSKLIPGCHWIHGQDNEDTRDYVLGQLRKSQHKKVVAICSSICNVGVNVFIHYLFNVAGGKEPNLTIQKMGRGLRVAPDKEALEYHDFIHHTNKYLESHSMERVKTLQMEGHTIEFD